MLTVKYIPNILNNEGRTIREVPFDNSKTLLDYLSEDKNFEFNSKVIVSGKVITDLSVKPVDEDEIIFTPNIEFVIPPAMQAFLTFMQIVLTVATIAYSIYQAISYKKPAVPNYGGGDDGLDESSPTYGWEGITTTQEVGIAIPIVYGEHMVGGNIINAYVRTDGDKNYLNVLLGISEGEIESITDIHINDNPIANFTGVSYTTKVGTNTDLVIPNFQDLHNLHTVGSVLTKNNSVVYTTVDSDIEAFEIHLQMPMGIYTVNGDGSLVAWAVTYQVEYKEHSAGSYTDLGTTTINDKSRSVVRRVYRKVGLTAGKYDIRITRTSDNSDDTHMGDLYLQQIDEIVTDDLKYPNIAKLGIEALASEQLSGGMPNITSIVKGRKVSIPRIINAEFYDNFNDNVLDIVKWDVSGNYGCAFEQNDELEFISQDATIWADISSNDSFNFTGKQLSIKIIDASRIGETGGEEREFWFNMWKVNGASYDSLEWNIFNGVLHASYYVAGVWTSIANANFNATNHKYLRIREASGIIYYDVSNDGLTWNSFGSVSTPFAITSLMVGVGIWVDDSAYLTTMKVDYIILSSATISDVAWEDYYYDPSDCLYKLLADDTELAWDGVSYINAFSANPVWCIKDILVNTRYGLGEFINTAVIDEALFLEMSQYCEEKVSDGDGGWEKRSRMDVVIDSSSKALDILLQLCSTFRGMLFFSQGAIKLRIDKPDTPVQLFGMGNIIDGSFTQNWKSLKDVPNVVEVQYLDKDNNYEQDTIAIADETALTNGDPMRKKQVKVFTTRVSQAIREGRYILWQSKYINRAITFKAGIDAIACQSGDIISVSHDVPQWGYSGRVQTGSTTTLVKLDRSVTLLPSTTYKIQVRFADDTIEERTISDPDGTYTQLNVSVAFSQTPTPYDVYVVGKSTIIKKDFRVMSMKRLNNNECEITAIEYNESVYDDTGVVLPTNNFSDLVLTTPDVTNIVLTERLIKLTDGTIENVIDVWFAKPAMTNEVRTYRKARLYLSDNAGASWVLKGETYGTHFAIQGDLTDSLQYRVAVVSVSDDNRENTIASSPYATITLIGKSAPPSDITAFLVNQSRDRLYCSWTGVDDVDLSGYEIRYGGSWEAGDILASGIKNTTFISLNLRAGADQNYWIKAIDTSFNYSANAKQAVITVDEIPFTNVISEYNEETAWGGTKVNTVKVGDDLELDTGYLTGTYVTPVRDVGYLATFKIGIEAIAVVASGDIEWDDDADLEFDDSATTRFNGTEISGALAFEIKTSEDNITWTDYASWQAGDYRCRYFQIRMTMARASTSIDLECSQLYYFTDLPDIDEFGSDTVSNATNGKAVSFEKTFHQEPNVHIEITSGDGIYSQFTTKDTTGFTVKLFDATGTAKTGDFDYHAHGI